MDVLLGKKKKGDGKQWQQKIEKLLPKYIINHRNNFFSLCIFLFLLLPLQSVSRFSQIFFLLFSFCLTNASKKKIKTVKIKISKK